MINTINSTNLKLEYKVQRLSQPIKTVLHDIFERDSCCHESYSYVIV